MFLHVTLLQLSSIPLKRSKNSLGLERSALIKTPSFTMQKLGNYFTMPQLFFFPPKH